MGSPTLGDPHRPLGLTPMTPLPPPTGEEVELGCPCNEVRVTCRVSFVEYVVRSLCCYWIRDVS